MISLPIVCLLSTLTFCMAFPPSYYNNGYEKTSRRAVMFGGYIGSPLGGRNLADGGGMTAIASGDTIASNSFVDDLPSSHNQHQQPEEVESDNGDQELETATVNSGKRSPKKHTAEEAPEEDEPEEDQVAAWPFGGSLGSSVFFPVIFGGSSGRLRAGFDEGGLPMGSAAIANSFSTGKGGVATSHATSFGDPYLGSYFRSAPSPSLDAHSLNKNVPQTHHSLSD